MNKVLHKFKAVLVASAVLLCGCSSRSIEDSGIPSVNDSAPGDSVSGASAEGDSAAGASSAEEAPADASSMETSEQLTEDNIGELVADKWAENWTAITSAETMLLPRIRVFSFDSADKSCTYAAFVLPCWKTTSTMLYMVNGGVVTELGMINSGFKFEVMSGGSDILLKTSSVIVGAGDINSFTDTYYLISGKNISVSATFERSEYQGTANAWYSGGEEVSEEEYNSAQKEAAEGFTSIKTVDFDADGDYRLDDYYDYEADPEGFADYLKNEFNQQ